MSEREMCKKTMTAIIILLVCFTLLDCDNQVSDPALKLNEFCKSFPGWIRVVDSPVTCGSFHGPSSNPTYAAGQQRQSPSVIGELLMSGFD